MPENVRHINLRVPDELHQQVVALAERNHRSLNSEIIAILEQAVREARRRDR